MTVSISLYPFQSLTSQCQSPSKTVPLNFCPSQLVSLSTCFPLSGFPSECVPLSIPSPQCHPLSKSSILNVNILLFLCLPLSMSSPPNLFLSHCRLFLKSFILKVSLFQYLPLSMFSPFNVFSNPVNKFSQEFSTPISHQSQSIFCSALCFSSLFFAPPNIFSRFSEYFFPIIFQLLVSTNAQSAARKSKPR